VGIAERKDRQRTEREHHITQAARLIAEREGWNAVTIRRLADEIEYSQPVIYSHFENRDAIVEAVAVEGFREFTSEIQEVARGSADPRKALENAATAYLAFALGNPALYAAMFTLPTSLRFADPEKTRPELRAAFRALAAVVAPFCADAEIATETFWASLHGLAELERTGRIRPNVRAERLALVVHGLLRS
jgi:AcrR family transcriptional regulator